MSDKNKPPIVLGTLPQGVEPLITSGPAEAAPPAKAAPPLLPQSMVSGSITVQDMLPGPKSSSETETDDPKPLTVSATIKADEAKTLHVNASLTKEGQDNSGKAKEGAESPIKATIPKTPTKTASPVDPPKVDPPKIVPPKDENPEEDDSRWDGSNPPQKRLPDPTVPPLPQKATQTLSKPSAPKETSSKPETPAPSAPPEKADSAWPLWGIMILVACIALFSIVMGITYDSGERSNFLNSSAQITKVNKTEPKGKKTRLTKETSQKLPKRQKVAQKKTSSSKRSKASMLPAKKPSKQNCQAKLAKAERKAKRKCKSRLMESSKKCSKKMKSLKTAHKEELGRLKAVQKKRLAAASKKSSRRKVVKHKAKRHRHKRQKKNFLLVRAYDADGNLLYAEKHYHNGAD